MTRLAATMLAIVLGLAPCNEVKADPPSIANLSPFGVQRGVATEFSITGGNLATNPELVASFDAKVETVENPGDAGGWRFRLTVPNEVAPGFYPLRVKTDGGISNPMLLAIGQVPWVAEAEPNNSFEQAQLVEPPVAIDGQVAGNDVDFFKFKGRQGQRMLIDAQCARIGSGVDPQLRLTKADRSFLASADDSPGLLTDARMAVDLPEDGEYILEISDSKYQGGGRPIYRLVIGELPAAEEVYPLGGRRGDTIGLELRGGTLPCDAFRVAATSLPAEAPGDLARVLAPSLEGPEYELPVALDLSDYPELREPSDPAAQPLKAVAPVVFNGRLESKGDEDRFRLVVATGQRLRIAVHAADLGSGLDGVLRVLNAANGQEIGNNDDSQVPAIRTRPHDRRGVGLVAPDPTYDLTVPDGVTEVELVLRDVAGRGGIGYPYRIVVEPIMPSFTVELGEAQVSVPKGGSVTFPVNLALQDLAAPITLTVEDPPAGLIVRPTKVAPGQTVGVLTLSASADADFGAVHLDVVGKADGASGPIVERAAKQIIFAQQANLPVNLQLQRGLPVAPSPVEPLAFEVSDQTLEAVHGYPIMIPFSARRGEGGEGELTISPLPLPPGLAIAELKLEANATEGIASVSVAPESPLGETSIGLIAKGKIGEKDRTFSLPAATLRVVRPVDLELAAPSIEVKPGESVELKGKLIRRGPFAETVTLQLNGLPTGLSAEPIEIASDSSEFTLTIQAAADAAATEAGAQVVLAPFKIAEKDYSVPPTPLTVKIVTP